MGSSATLNDPAGQTKPGSITVMGLPISAIAFLILTLIYSLDLELQWCQMDTMARNASNFTGLHIVPVHFHP